VPVLGKIRSMRRLLALSAGSGGGDHPQSALVEQQSAVVPGVDLTGRESFTDLVNLILQPAQLARDPW
jgi:hypothetical protein